MKWPLVALIQGVTVMYKKAFILILALFPSLGFADWIHIDKVDDFSDESIKYALHISPHHTLQVSRENGMVWMFITRKDVGTIEPDGLIQLRVDKNKTLKIDPAKAKRMEELMGKAFYNWEPMTVGFNIWHGEETVGKDCGFVSQLISGQELKFRYQINSLETESFEVSLEGAKEAIIKGLELKVCS